MFQWKYVTKMIMDVGVFTWQGKKEIICNLNLNKKA